MADWNAQMMLDLYIHNYLMKKNMHTTAEIFATEANFRPKPVAIDPPEGFLSEWWSIFWSAYSTKIPVNLETTEGSSSKAPQNVGNAPSVVVHPTMVLPSSDVNSMLNGKCTTIQRPEHSNQTCDPTIVPKPNTKKLLQSSISATRPRPDSNLNRFIPVRISHQSVLQGKKITSLIDAMRDQERLRLPIDQLACMMPSSSNCSNPQKKDYKKRLLSITEDDNSRTSLRIEEQTDASVCEQDCLTLSIKNFNSNSQLLDADQLACLLSSSNNCSSPQKNLYKRSRFSITRDEECGTSSRRSAAAEATHNAPKGTSTSTNSSSSNA